MAGYTKDEWKSTLKYDCGCQILERISGKSISGTQIIATMIDYCPKHKAALELYETLKFAVRQIEELHKQKGEFGLTNAILGIAEQTLAKAEGEN
jgi:hypothetical protein